MQQQPNIQMTCPVCADYGVTTPHVWPALTRGKRSCPKCSTSVVCSKLGIKVLQLPVERAISGNGSTDEQRLFKVFGAVESGKVKCSGCGLYVDTLNSIDGRMDGDTQGITRVRIETGEDVRSKLPTGFKRHAHFETRFIPKHVRGIICDRCASDYRVTVKTIAPATKFRPLKIAQIRHHNSKVQRIAAERVEGLIAYCLLKGDYASSEMIWNTQAAIVHSGGEKLTASAGWSGMRWTWHRGNLLIAADSGWLGAMGIESISEDANGYLTREYHPSAHPRLCGCLDCARRENVRPFNPVTLLDRHILRVPLDRPHMAVGHALGSYQRPLGVTSPAVGIGRLAVSIGNALQGPARSIPPMPFSLLTEPVTIDCGEFGKVRWNRPRKVWRINRQLQATEMAIGPAHCIHLLPPIMCALCGPNRKPYRRPTD